MNRKHFLRILSAALLPALLSACAAQRPELYAMRNGGSHQPFYFTDRYGELAFREFYDWAGQVVGDRAVVERDGKWGDIDRSGETVVPFRYDWAGSFGQYGFDEEVAMVKTGMDRDRIPLYTPCPTALIDRDGERITPVYGFMTPIVGGVSFVNDGRKFHGVGRDLLASDGKWGCVDRRGRLVVACEYELAYPLFDRFAFVRKDGKWGVLDRRGRLIVPCRYDAGYYRAGIYVLDTLFDTQDTPPTDGVNPAVRGEFEEGRIYMIADGCAEAFDMKGRKIGK